MDIPYGHRNKILKKLGIREDNSNSLDTKSLSKNNYEELPMEADDFYDEQKQRKVFQEAVEAFRKTKDKEDNYDKFSKEISNVKIVIETKL
jgi:hypothetical protein